jgi:hypothetical protein
VKLADLAYRRPARGEVLDHLRRHLARIGGDALVGDAVITGEDRDHGVVEGWFGLALPARQKLDEFLKPAQRTTRLGERQVARAHRFDCRLIAAGHDVDKIENVGVRRGHGGFRRGTRQIRGIRADALGEAEAFAG